MDLGILADAGSDAPACTTDLECDTGDLCAPARCLDGACQASPPVVCDDGDDCSVDTCEPTTGACLHEPITPDTDGDGYRAPRPGFAAGAPGACGDDCDDRSAAAHPHGKELCDGVDNDCNGSVDDGALFSPDPGPVRVSSASLTHAEAASLAFDGRQYALTYQGYTDRERGYFQGLARDGSAVVPELVLSNIASDSSAGELVYNGRFYGTSFDDARQDGNYEVYFNGLNASGGKLRADLRVTAAPRFSLHSQLAWNGLEFLVVWDDRRFEARGSDQAQIFGQRVSVDGAAIGDNLALTLPGTDAESPALAIGTKKVGIVFAAYDGITARARFFSTEPDLSQPGPFADVGLSDVDNPSVLYAGGRFLVVWSRAGSNTLRGDAIWGAVVSEDGAVLVPEHPITQGATVARSQALLSLGNRVLMVWADDHDGNYELYEKTLDLDLTNTSERNRLTTSTADSLYPKLSFGPNGDIGVLYDDWQSGSQQVYFTRLGCVPGGGTSP